MWITKSPKITWIDILKPTKGDVDFLKKQHNFHPIILDELLHYSSRSRVEYNPSYLFLTYHLPIYDKNLKTSRRAEVDFLITANKVITVHYEDLEPLDNFMRTISNSQNFKNQAMESTARCTYYIIQAIIGFSMRQLRHVEDNIHYISQEIFKGHEAQLLEKISYAKRDILDYQVISSPQEILLNSLIDVGNKFWNEQYQIYFDDLVGDYSKVTQHMESYRATIESLETTNGQLLSAKTNAVMQKFTIFAFMAIPLSIFVGLGSIDFINVYFAAHPAIFWIILLVLGIIMITSMIVFKKRGWL